MVIDEPLTTEALGEQLLLFVVWVNPEFVSIVSHNYTELLSLYNYVVLAK